ncbi:MAG: MFS transporter [Oligoflexia bacterium]|nr:MFS transporter [Oligoflexia bacterium]
MSRLRLRRPSPILSIFLIVLVDILGLTLILPLLPFYAERLGATPSIASLLVSIYAFCQLVAGPALGQLSDRIGRKPVLILSQAGTLAGFILLAFSTRLWMVMLSRAIDGLTAGNITVAQAYISDVTDPKNRTRAFGLIGAAFGLGFLIGPAISGFLAQYDFHYPMFGAALLSALSILSSFVLLPRASRDEHPQTAAARQPIRLRLPNLVERWNSYVAAFREPALSGYLWKFFAFSMSFGTFIGGLALFAERRYVWKGLPLGPQQIGYVFAISGLVGVVIQGGLIGRLSHRLGEKKLVDVGFASMIIGNSILGLSRGNVTGLIVGVLFQAFGGAVIRPALTRLITDSTGSRGKGFVVGLMQSLMSVAQILAPMLGGWLIQQGLLSLWAFWVSALAVIGIMLKPDAKNSPTAVFWQYFQ